MKQIAQSSLDMVSNLSCESSEKLISKFECLRHVPAYILVKDINSRVVALTQLIAEMVGWHNIEDAIGTIDYEIPCKVSELAEQFILQDQQVVNSKHKSLTMTIGNYAKGRSTNLCVKDVLKNDNQQVIGIYCQLFNISNANSLVHAHYLDYSDQKTFGIRDSITYSLNPEHSPLPSLTPRQESIVFLMIRGKPMKEIAYILKISARTVESHIEDIKFRLGCYTKGQVIEKAIDAGFLYYIPEGVIK